MAVASSESEPSSPSWSEDEGDVGDVVGDGEAEEDEEDEDDDEDDAAEAAAEPRPPPPPKRKRPLALKPLSLSLEGLVNALMRRDTYQFFCEPVNADEVPGYREVITHPMDLGTMRARVSARAYPHMDAFRADFLRVTRNAQLFNPPTSIFHTAAKRLETWGLRAIDREAAVVADDAAFEDAHVSRAPQTRRRRTEYTPRAPVDVRIGSARPSTMTPSAPDEPPELYMLRRTLAYAGISRGALTGKNACTARTHARAKARLGPVPAALQRDAEQEEPAIVYADDGSVDPAGVADVGAFLAQRMGAWRILAPALESVQHLPMTGAAGAAEPAFPPARRARPDALFPGVLATPAPAADNWSHMLATDLPCAVSAVRPPPPFGTRPGARALPAAWPAPRAGHDLLAGMRTNRRERELELERDETNWTVFRPHLVRPLAPTDVGLFSALPTWAAGDDTLRPYAAVSGGALVQAVREQLRAVPYYALGLPRTAQFVPRASLQQLPLSLKMTMQGAQQTERLVDVVYGGVQGLAAAQSMAAFAGGAAAAGGGGSSSSSSSGLAAHVRDTVVDLTSGLLGTLDVLGGTLEHMHVPDTPRARPVHPLVDLLDDRDGAVARAVADAVPGARGGTLAECLYELLGPST